MWVEDPGYPGAKGVFHSAGARLVPVPVDSEGLSVAEGAARCPEARAASAYAAEYGVEALPLSAYAVEPTERGGLLLGYTAVDVPEIRAGVRQLAHALHGMRKGKRASAFAGGSI